MSSPSPMQTIGTIPCPKADRAFAATVASSSAWYCRRSEGPTTTYDAPSFASLTGATSPVILAKLGASYVVVGHSERRQYHAEDDATVAAKARSAFGQGIVPIVCIGEGLDIRKAGQQVEYTLAQLDGSLAGLTAEQAAQVVIAYEPVWAIGTGEVATPEDAQEVCGEIRRRLGELYSPELAAGVRVLYGGSVKSGNIAAVMTKTDVDGALVGGASLDAEEFARIVRYQSHQVGL